MSFNAKKLVNIFVMFRGKTHQNDSRKVLSKIVLKCVCKCLIINNGQNPCPPTKASQFLRGFLFIYASCFEMCLTKY
jgi:hypothetical protein